MRLLFCSESNDLSRVEGSLEREWAAARAAGFPCELLWHDEAIDTPDRSVRRLAARPQDVATETLLYRGWMFRPDRYERLFDALSSAGLRLFNSPDQYKRCHWLPEWYPLLEGETPASVWTTGIPPMDEIMQLLHQFGDRPLVLKDYVKSQKHDWTGSCFIPCASDRAAVERVISGFLEWTGSDVNGGLVFREFVELDVVGHHPRSRTPLAREVRIWFLNGKSLGQSKYWDEAAYASEGLDLSYFELLAQRIDSRFFSMDVAQKKSGEWTIIELGDGQVSGLPNSTDANRFYADLRASLAH